MAVGRNNGVVGLTGFSNKRCVGFGSGLSLLCTHVEHDHGLF